MVFESLVLAVVGTSVKDVVTEKVTAGQMGKHMQHNSRESMRVL